MTPKEFVRIVHREASEDTLDNYSDALASDDLGEDPAWTFFWHTYRGLSADDRRFLLGVVRMIQADSIAAVLAVLDNQLSPAVQAGEFTLLHDSAVLNGDLSDIFWELEEDGWE